MKKLLMAALALIGFSAATLAQTTAPSLKKNDPAKAQVVKKTITPATPVTTKPAAATSPAAAAPLKKDGTPDKRYKANQASAAAGPVKKDGTPDMRYKANKKKG